MLWMDSARARVNQAAASKSKQQAAGGYEVSVEALEQRQQRRRQDHVDNPARAHRALKCDRRHELLTGQFVPRSHECDCGDDNRVKKNADQDRHPYGFEKSLRSRNSGAGFLRGLAHRFESSHEIRDDLQHQQKRDQTAHG